MDTIKSALNAARAAGEAAVLCAVVERRGSAPRGPGAMMAVTASQVAGTIGGGLVEYEAQQEARRVLETKAFAQRTYRLTNESAADLGMICGGEVMVWFHYLAPAEIPDLAAGRYLTLTEGGGAVVSDHSEPGVHGGRFSVALQRPGMVYVFGGGHVSQALVPALARVDFSVTVLEERTEFLTPELFPDAQALIHADYLRLSDFITMTPDDYAVVMTRGHQGDFEILRQLLQSPRLLCRLHRQPQESGRHPGAAPGGRHRRSAHPISPLPHRPRHRRGDPGGDRRFHHGADDRPSGRRGSIRLIDQIFVRCSFTFSRDTGIITMTKRRSSELPQGRNGNNMYKIVCKKELNPSVTYMEIEAPFVARKAKAGQFIIFRIDERGERVPLTIAGYDREKGTVSIIFQKVGLSTNMLGQMNEGDYIQDFVGPLGKPTEVEGMKRVCVVGGGVGCAIAYPSAKAFKEAGVEVDVIVGFRNKDIVILEDEFKAASDHLYLMTDDGSYGEKGFVTVKLQELLEAGNQYDEVLAIGPIPMMKFVAKTTEPFGVKTIVSLNPIMVDGTGMCGGCRVTVGGEVKFACVDGPDFDGHKVDFAELMSRNGVYRDRESRDQQDPYVPPGKAGPGPD